MKTDGDVKFDAPREAVWKALNDVAVLQACIPGCESLSVVGENEFQAKVRAKVGPVNSSFNTTINLEDVVEPESYSLRVHSKGGAAGIGEAIARVNLIDESPGTSLKYEVEFKVKGKLAQIGSRLIMNVIQKLSREFFESFESRIKSDT